ncbi:MULTISPECIES: FUSC family protein [unclassified Francisella]|uniref:FUSC family protein n=1 Tax=unclassified Francisella TaxID=2610885 RepID=UPI002E33A9BC|nr:MULTISPECIES: FUSC family protein [unclassified Francisella]MED7820095.1 FUSC family protein [Francisella sp. 19S2-4]MED7830915.1 FUSC family protein [Francisella sp. 19S2-10]
MIEEIFTKKNLIYTLKAFISIGLALYISMSMGLDKPIWAMIIAIFLALRPEAGFIVEKSLFLILSTIIGIIIGFSIVSLFLPYPSLAIFSLCILIIITMLFSVNDSHSNFTYGITLTNITCTIIVLYSIANPSITTEEMIFHTGFSRISAIIVGALSSCFVNYYIFPIKIEDTVKKKVADSFDLVIKYTREIFSAQDFHNNEKYNKQVEKILDSLIALDNDLTANRFENIKTSTYYKFLNSIIELIQSAHYLRKQTIKSDSKEFIKKDLHEIYNQLDTFDHKKKITYISSNTLIETLIRKFNTVIDNYQKINNKDFDTFTDNTFHHFKNYANSMVSLVNISRTICIFLFLSFIWLNTQSDSQTLLLMIIIPTVFSQVFVHMPDTTEFVKKTIRGMIISIPFSIIITLNLLAQVVGYFELLMLVTILTLFIPIMVLTIPKFQPYSIGFIFGWICLIQPSNHMTFEISKLLSSGLSALFGCIVLWLAFKLCPQYPYKISRRLAILSIIKDRKKLRQKEIVKKQYNAKIIKKILCVYKNRENNNSSEKDIKFALRSLIKSI